LRVHGVAQLTSSLDQLRRSAVWLSEDTRLEFWKKAQQFLTQHSVTPVTAANFLQVGFELSSSLMILGL